MNLSNGQQDPLLGADPNVLIRQLAELKMHLELELMQRDQIVEKLYARVKELELENNLLRSDKEKAEA